jgi:NAD(P)-dependent dehydrogenase (short-subunit alcohol dehydrogenase family)
MHSKLVADVLVQNAAISNIRKTQLGLNLQEGAKLGVASKVSLDEVRAICETNVFGVLAVYQAMLPLRCRHHVPCL